MSIYIYGYSNNGPHEPFIAHTTVLTQTLHLIHWMYNYFQFKSISWTNLSHWKLFSHSIMIPLAQQLHILTSFVNFQMFVDIFVTIQSWKLYLQVMRIVMHGRATVGRLDSPTINDENVRPFKTIVRLLKTSYNLFDRRHVFDTWSKISPRPIS